MKVVDGWTKVLMKEEHEDLNLWLLADTPKLHRLFVDQKVGQVQNQS